MSEKIGIVTTEKNIVSKLQEYVEHAINKLSGAPESRITAIPVETHLIGIVATDGQSGKSKIVRTVMISVPAPLRLENFVSHLIVVSHLIATHSREQSIPFHLTRQVPTIWTKALNRAGNFAILATSVTTCLRVFCIGCQPYRINGRSPSVKASRQLAVPGFISEAPASSLEARGLRTVGIIQIFGHPHLVANFHRSINFAVT